MHPNMQLGKIQHLLPNNFHFHSSILEDMDFAEEKGNAVTLHERKGNLVF